MEHISSLEEISEESIYQVFDAKTKRTVDKRQLSYRFTPFAKDNRPVKGRELDIRGKCPPGIGWL